MSNLAICKRYAAALYAEAESGEIVDRVDEDVAMTRESLEGSRELRLFFASPVISASTKRSGIETLFRDRVSDVFLRFLLLLNEKGRGDMVTNMLEAYGLLRNKILGIVEAKARVAMALSDPEVEALRKRLADRVGADVKLHVEEDPDLVGGVVVRIGDTVYDGSLKHRLSALKMRLERGSILRN